MALKRIEKTSHRPAFLGTDAPHGRSAPKISARPKLPGEKMRLLAHPGARKRLYIDPQALPSDGQNEQGKGRHCGSH